MKVYHLNCITTSPLIWKGHLSNHCLLVETNRELVLIDTGFGLNDVRDPKARLSKFFLKQLQPDFKEELTAYRQIQRLGLDPRDVRHILLSHLDFDHAGGLDDFPEARVHMLKIERDYAFSQKTWLDRQRFRPEQWSTKNNWNVYEPSNTESWFGLNRVNDLVGLPSEIVMIPLIGHTHGHAGVAVKSKNKWLFNAGDSYFHHEEMNLENPNCPNGLKIIQAMMDKNHEARLWNQARLRELKRSHSNEVEIFCSHDIVEFERLAGHPIDTPIDHFARLHEIRMEVHTSVP